MTATPRRTRRISRAEWLAEGRALFGDDMRAWRFRCVRCGHVQSHQSAKARTPDIGDTSNWINFSCEGRKAPAVGCDWTLGGLFSIQELEVVDELHDGKIVPSFEFDKPENAAYYDEKRAAYVAAKAKAEAKSTKHTLAPWVSGGTCRSAGSARCEKPGAYLLQWEQRNRSGVRRQFSRVACKEHAASFVKKNGLDDY